MYELLTCKRPFDGAQSPNNAIILQPSGELRGGPWYARVRGDLDAITAKATHADPARRYASAADMHDDLQRFLNHRPIRARPDTLSYRLGKLVHRKPYLVPIAIISFFAIAGYITTLTIHARELEIEQRRASAAQAFLVDLLRSPDPFAPADPDKGQDITVVEALDIGVERLESDTYSDPELRVSLLNTISSVYAGLDRHKSAIQLREESLSMERVLYGNDTSQVIDSLVLLGQQCQVLGDYAAATSYFEEQLEIAQRIYGKDDPRLGAAEAAIAPFYFQQGLGNQKDGIKLLESGIEKMRGDAGHSRDLINALVELATWLKHTDPNAALARLGEALELAHLNYGTESLSAALVHAQIATNWSTQSNYDNAESEFLQALAIYESKVGPDHGAAISTLSNLGTMALRMGKLEEAEKIFGQILKRFQRKYGTDHQEVANSYQNLATALTRQGRYEESVPMHRKAVEIYDNVLLGDHYIASFPRMSLAYAQIQLGDFTDAEASAREAFGVLQQSMPESWMAGVAQCLVGVALEGQGLAKEGSEQIESSHRLLLSGNVGTPYRELCRLPEA
jgi:serine/threonine-protein kinase